MELRAVLNEVATTYDRTQGTGAGVKGQRYLREISKLDLPIPVGLLVSGNGGDGSAALCPWIGVHDPDLRSDAATDLFLAYIFAGDLRSVTLTVQQGVEGLTKTFGKGKRRREHLERRSRRLQQHIPGQVLTGWLTAPKLESDSARPLAYESGSIAARRYEINTLPPEEELRNDLWRGAEILQYAAQVDPTLWVSGVDEGIDVAYDVTQSRHAPESYEVQIAKNTLLGFRPRTDAEYVARMSKQRQERKPRHEGLINDFVELVASRGFEAHNIGVKPRDLVLRKGDTEWLVEAKIVYAGNVTKAVREAVAQLYEYRYFCSDGDPRMLALFSEDIYRFADYLETLNIGAVWRTTGGWRGTTSAVAWGVLDGG
jgi:hypothetical protein